MNNVGDKIQASNAGWSFGGEVPKSFESHVQKSVPLYSEGHELILRTSDYFLDENSTVYDLGTSTGSLLRKMADYHATKRGLRLIGVDREEAMVREAKELCSSEKRIEIVLDELHSLEMEKCDLIISYYTIQFIRPAIRQDIFNKLYNSLNWGGALFLFEKVRGPDARFQDILTGLYTDYKLLDQGYSTEEVVGKTRSLKGVLEPFSTEGNNAMLTRAGFKDIMSIMKYICFEGTLAIK